MNGLALKQERRVRRAWWIVGLRTDATQPLAKAIKCKKQTVLLDHYQNIEII
jgi:hypothetical protein